MADKSWLMERNHKWLKPCKTAESGKPHDDTSNTHKPHHLNLGPLLQKVLQLDRLFLLFLVAKKRNSTAILMPM